MSQFDGLLAMIPVGDIAKQLGIDESVAELAVQQVLPALVSGMAANAKDEAGAKSLEKAIATVLPIVARSCSPGPPCTCSAASPVAAAVAARRSAVATP